MTTYLPNKPLANARPNQRGVFLLEALIAILIIAFGVLGSVGLLARSLQNIDDSKFRGEAAYLANSYLGLMWVDDRTPATLDANFNSIGGGAAYTEFKAVVQQRLPNAPAPTVTFAAGPTVNTSLVTIVVGWRGPGDPGVHFHRVSGAVGAN